MSVLLPNRQPYIEQLSFEAVDGKIIPRDTYLASWRQIRLWFFQTNNHCGRGGKLFYALFDPVELGDQSQQHNKVMNSSLIDVCLHDSFHDPIGRWYHHEISSSIVNQSRKYSHMYFSWSNLFVCVCQKSSLATYYAI